MATERLDPDPQLNRILVIVRQQLRVALQTGQYGDWTAQVPVHNGKPGKWQSGFREIVDLTDGGADVKR